VNIIGSPWAGLKSEGDASSWGFSPGSVLTTDVFSLLSNVVVLWDWKKFSESLLNKIYVFFMIFNTTSDNKAFSWSNIIHDELLKHSSVNVVHVVSHTQSWHTKGVISISGSQKELLLGGEWIELSKMVIEIVRLGVLRSGNISSNN